VTTAKPLARYSAIWGARERPALLPPSYTIIGDTTPFTEGEIRGDDYRGTLVEPADEVEQELAAGLGEGQIAEFVRQGR
jgi:hypothetical protein